MLKSYGVVVGGRVAHVILVSAQVSLVLTLGLWDFGLGLDNIFNTNYFIIFRWLFLDFFKKKLYEDPDLQFISRNFVLCLHL